jgi:hypothetical protein
MQSQSWLLLYIEPRHEIKVAAEIDAAMEADWACVPMIVVSKPIGRRKTTIRWHPVLPGCILVPFENSGQWDGLRYATGYARDAQEWPIIIPGPQVARFTQFLSALNSVLLRRIEREAEAARISAEAKKKKHKYVTATTQDLLNFARATFGVDLSGNLAA